MYDTTNWNMLDIRLFNWLIIFGGYFLVIKSAQLLSEDQVRNIYTWKKLFVFNMDWKDEQLIETVAVA